MNRTIIEALEPLKLSITVSEHPVYDENGNNGLPETFLVIIPIRDMFLGYADDVALAEKSEVELALYTKGNYLSLRDVITGLLFKAGLSITERRYLEYEKDTGYHHYIFTIEGGINEWQL